MLAVLKGSFAISFLALNVVAACVPLFLAAPLKYASRNPAWRDWWSTRLNPVITWWVGNNAWLLRTLRLTDLQVTGCDNLRPDQWYLVLSNHRSWADIVLLQVALNRRASPLKFFTKKQLVWLPFLGLALKSLDFPMMRRYSAEQVAANPALRQHDLATTARTCARIRSQPTSLFIFPEGTRWTSVKHQAQASPFQHLLKPKAGGAAFALGNLGDRIEAVLDVTIVYPDANPDFWDLLCGRIARVEVRVDALPVPAEASGDYQQDAALRAWYQRWLGDLWQAKDQQLQEAWPCT